MYSSVNTVRQDIILFNTSSTAKYIGITKFEKLIMTIGFWKEHLPENWKLFGCQKPYIENLLILTF